MVSYKILDIYGNRFLARYDKEEQTLELGSSRAVGSANQSVRSSCVRIRILDEFHALLDDYFYDILCSEDGLVRGEKGTRSMLYCALSVAKHIHPNLRTFELQDEATLKKTSVPLHLMYLITRGKTYYNSLFPELKLNKERKQREYLKDITTMSGLVNRSLGEIMKEFSKAEYFAEGKCFGTSTAPDVIKRIYNECYMSKSWYTFFHKISRNYEDYFWVEYIRNIQDFMNISSYEGRVWDGQFEYVRNTIKKAIRISEEIEFPQTGGNVTYPGKKYDSGDQYFELFGKDCPYI